MQARQPVGEEGWELKTIAITPSRVDISPEAKCGGTLVLVGSYAWMAKIDQKPASEFRVIGAFLGARPSTPDFHRAIFEYRRHSGILS
jgi:hypothetical protein